MIKVTLIATQPKVPSLKTLFSICFLKADIVKTDKYLPPCQKTLLLVRKSTLTPLMKRLHA